MKKLFLTTVMATTVLNPVVGIFNKTDTYARKKTNLGKKVEFDKLWYHDILAFDTTKDEYEEIAQVPIYNWKQDANTWEEFCQTFNNLTFVGKSFLFINAVRPYGTKLQEKNDIDNIIFSDLKTTTANIKTTTDKSQFYVYKEAWNDDIKFISMQLALCLFHDDSNIYYRGWWQTNIGVDHYQGDRGFIINLNGFTLD